MLSELDAQILEQRRDSYLRKCKPTEIEKQTSLKCKPTEIKIQTLCSFDILRFYSQTLNNTSFENRQHHG